MFKHVKASTVKPLKNFCSNKLNQVKMYLKKEFNLDSEFFLVGSGVKNLVTRNENEPFDLDWNLVILNLPFDYPNIEKELKQNVMSFLNKILEGSPFSDCQDSTSVITSNWKTKNGVRFSFDLAILAIANNGNFLRLIHDKRENRFFWNEVPTSKDVSKRTEILKKNGLWQDVRKEYLNKKNMYLQRNDKNHPSFIVFIETVNEVYNGFINKNKTDNKINEMRKLVGTDLSTQNAKSKLMELHRNGFISQVEFSEPENLSENGVALWKSSAKVKEYSEYWWSKQNSIKSAEQNAALCLLKYTILGYERAA